LKGALNFIVKDSSGLLESTSLLDPKIKFEWDPEFVGGFDGATHPKTLDIRLAVTYKSKTFL
jgi:hypothetical protein